MKEEKKSPRLSMDHVMFWLTKVYGVPKNRINQIRTVFAADAVREAHNVHMDRIFAGVALMLNRAYDLEPEDIMRGLAELDHIYMNVLEPGASWTDHMDMLAEETGIVIRTGDDDRLIIEYVMEDEEGGEDAGDPV